MLTRRQVVVLMKHLNCLAYYVWLIGGGPKPTPDQTMKEKAWIAGLLDAAAARLRRLL